MLGFCRNVVKFFVDCFDALRDEPIEQPNWHARQQRWLEYLSSR